MHFLITGHTGFKGAWFTLLLKELGHTVSGYSDSFKQGSLYEIASLSDDLDSEQFGDVRDQSEMNDFFLKTKPDVAIHFAAQSLVRESYRDPGATFSTNVNGTINFLEAIRNLDSATVSLVVTTDKVYKDSGDSRYFVESDPLQGSEPYGQSKAIADMTAQFWMNSKLIRRMAIARAGNVIGGGDVCAERLMPELITSYASGLEPTLRLPNAIRPWQHVLDCLNAYISIVNDLLGGGLSDVWNIGPDTADHVSVRSVQEQTAELFGRPKSTALNTSIDMPETQFLALNSEKIRSKLGWANSFDLKSAVSSTVSWHQQVRDGQDPKKVSLEQIRDFIEN
jgi:CDP-glucose 4,6-dehydratase